MDEFESRLSDGLEGRARHTPTYAGDLGAITRRGRRRRWAQRSVGAVGAAAILGGAFLASRVVSDEPGENLATEDGGIPVIVTETPTPTPTPLPTPDPALVGTPLPVPTPLPETVVRDVFAVTATGWGTGLVGSSGEYFASLICCDGEVVDWQVQPVGPAAGALRVRDDLQGGLIASTSNALWWQPAATLGSGMEPTLLAEATDTSADNGIELWDVIVIEDTMRVLYSTWSATTDQSTGAAALWSVSITGGTPAEPEQLSATSWDTIDQPDAYRWNGAGWADDGGRMELRAAADGACEWIVFENTDGSYESPFPAPATDGECQQDSIGAATINAAGQLAVISKYLSVPPSTAEVAVFDRQGNPLSIHALPETPDGTPRWTELDMVGSDVLASRGAIADPTLDQVVRLDISRTQDPSPLPFVGNPSFARSDIDTDRLQTVGVDSDLWFGVLPTTSDDEPEDAEPDSTPDQVPTPVADPTPAPDAAPPADDIGPELREPDPDRAPVQPGAIAGDDGCLGAICIGGPTTDVAAELELLFGPLTLSADPDQPGTIVFATDQIEIVVEIADPASSGGETVLTGDDAVSRLEVRPLAPFTSDVSPLGNDVSTVTMSDVLVTLGAPTAVTNAFEGDVQVVWLQYETADAVLRFGLVGIDADDTLLLDPGDTSLPTEYDELVIRAYAVETRG